MPFDPGARVGPYRIVDTLGAGGMGVVYRAHDARLGRDVAIKFLPAAWTSDPERQARFEREARILAALNHPHIAAIYGIEEAQAEDGTHVRGLVLELVEGATLAEWIATDLRPKAHPAQGSKPVDPTKARVSEALRFARQIVDALDAAHEKGIVHRDLKPLNIKIAPGGIVKVLDFGLAKSTDTKDRSGSATMSHATREGSFIGTPAYMSPEQARAQPQDKRTDIWAFGCVLYEMLAGRPAFEGGTTSDTIAAVLREDPDWAALPGSIPRPIRRLLARCLTKDP
jgi:serine/threonine protein kinase